MNGSIAMCGIFMEPKTIVDSKNRIWTLCNETTYYNNQTGHTCPLVYIESWKTDV